MFWKKLELEKSIDFQPGYMLHRRNNRTKKAAAVESRTVAEAEKVGY